MGLVALLAAACFLIASAIGTAGIFVFLAGLCVAFWSYLVLSVKRLRHLNASPWWTGLVFVPGAGIGVMTLALLALPGARRA